MIWGLQTLCKYDIIKCDVRKFLTGRHIKIQLRICKVKQIGLGIGV